MKSVLHMARQSNFELLRIVSILFIAIYHAAVGIDWGFDIQNYSELTFDVFFVEILRPLGKIGVNLFVLISGYFLVKSTSSVLKKFLKVWVQLFTISIISAVLALLIFGELAQSVFYYLTPFIHNAWWFATSYLIMLLVSPLLNRIILKSDRQKHFKIILVLFSIQCLLFSCTNIRLDENRIIWFMVLYFIASYIRLYPPQKSNSFYEFVAVVCYVCSAFFFLLFASWGNEFALNAIKHENSFFIAMCAIAIFIRFSRLDLGCSETINKISACTFGVYLILSDYELKIRSYEFMSQYNSPVCLCLIFWVIVTFSLATIVSYVYTNTIVKYLDWGIDRLFENRSEKENGPRPGQRT